MATEKNGAAPAARKVKLSKAITTHSGSVAEITLQPINAGVMMRMGTLPFTIQVNKEGQRSSQFDFKKCADYISELSGIEVGLLEQMPNGDFQACINELTAMLFESGSMGN